MKHYILISIQVLLSALILIFSFMGLIPATVMPYLLIAMFLILICDLAYEAVISIINLRLFDDSIYICVGTIALIFATNTEEALICLLLLRIFKLLMRIFCNVFIARLSGLTHRLLPKNAHTESADSIIPCNELKPGDTIILNPSEVLSVDCVLLDSCALFTPVFSTSAPTEYLQGDEVPGGFRLISEEPVSLHVTTHFEDSTFTKYIRAFKAGTCNPSSDFGIIRLLPKALLLLGVIGTLVSLFLPSVTKASALLIFLTCCVFVTTENIISFFDKLQFYSFQKGVLLSGNVQKLAKTKAFYISKSAVIKASEYAIAAVCPAKSLTDEANLLKYAAQAEIPYAHTGIGDTLVKAVAAEVLLSAVKHTEAYPELGILTKYNNDTIHAGCKEFLITSGIGKLPDFTEIEADSDICDTFVYVALNNTYIGYIRLQAPLKSSYSDFIEYTRKKRILAQVVLHNSPDEADALVATRQALQKKCRTSNVAYIDSKPTDSVLQSMSDYNIFLGSRAYCRENAFSDVTIIPNSFKTLLRTIRLAKKVYFTANLYTVLIMLIKAGLITASFLLPGIKVWYVLLADGIISTILIKVYDLLFRLFTRLN